MKIIFLDIDGVLNSRQWILQIKERFDDPKNQMDLKLVKRFNHITESTKANIVISSTWRYSFRDQLKKLQECMVSYGISGNIIGMTDCSGYGNCRSDEIEEWLNNNSGIERFIIIDDNTLGGKMDQFLIKTDWEDGLQDHHVDQIIKLLT